MKLSQRQLIIIGVAVLLVIGIISIFMFGGVKQRLPDVTLMAWGTEPPTFFDQLSGGYKGIRSNVKIEYRQFPAQGYEDRILQALAAGNGPDIFEIGNRELPTQENKLVPVSPTVFPLTKLEALFPTVVEQDFADQGYLYALPFSIDTLALYYNKDFFDQAAIVTPPATWKQLLEDVAALRTMDDRGNIIRAAVALGGTSQTVAYAPDILQLLLLQNGTQMANGGISTFASQEEENKSLNALQYYLQFTDAGNSVYTWNEAMPDSRAAFAAGKVAMILDYHSAMADIAQRSPFLRFGVAPAPQVSPDSPLAFPRYRGLAVSRQSKNAAWAWDFIVSVTTNPSIAGGYLATSGEPPALKSLIASKTGDPQFETFARQALAARSWQSPDETNTDAAFDGIIRDILLGRSSPRAALEKAAATLSNSQ